MSDPREDDDTDRWVAEVNRLARAMDDYAEGTHPSALQTDPHFQQLRSEYLATAQGGEEYVKAKKRRPRRTAKRRR